MYVIRFFFFLLFWVWFLLPTRGQAFPDRMEGAVPLSVQPNAIQVGPTDRYVYILDAAAGSLSVVDSLSFSESTVIPFSGVPGDFGINADGSTLYIVTDAADSVVTMDLADPAVPSTVSTLSLGTSGIVFDNILVAGSSGADLLVLSSRDQDAIYVFDRQNDQLRFAGSEDHINTGFDPLSITITNDRGRIAVLSDAGDFKTYLTSSLIQVGSTIDLGAFTNTESFSHLHVGLLSVGDYAFATNKLSAGEVFLINMVDTNNNLFVQDADSASAGTTDPVLVLDSPSGSRVVQVNRSKDDSSLGATYLYVANRTSGNISVIDTAKIGGSDKVEPIATIESVADVPPLGLAASSTTDGHLYALNRAGSSVSVITDQPFVTLVGAPTAVIGTEDAQVTVRSTEAGTLSVVQYTGATTDVIAPSNGNLLATSSIDAETDTNISFATDSLIEGANTIALFVENGALSGRKAFTLTKDTAPLTPKNFKLSFGNGKIFATWNRVNQDDISHYLVRFGTTTDAVDGIGTLATPQQVSQPGSGSLAYTIEPVPNGTTVYANVVTIDQTGNQSVPTETLSETAEETIGILGLTGETGGCASSNAAWMWLFLPFLFLRPKRTLVLPFFITIVIGLPASKGQAASLVSKETEKTVAASTEFRVGWWLPQENAVQQFLGEAGNEFYLLRVGVLYKDLDFGVEGGVLTEKSNLIGVTTGRQSGESTRVTLIPTEFSVQYNVSFWEDPLIVPFARIGYDMVYFRISEPINSESGIKHATTFSGGLRLMLDRFGTTNDMEELLGIRHFYLEGLASYRYQFSDGIDFGGWIFQPGIGIEF